MLCEAPPKLVTIVTVAFNNRDGIVATHASLRPAKTEDVEWVVVDGGSKDGSVEYLQSCLDVDAYISESDEGIYHAMSKGLGIAKGEYVLFLNSGDMLSEGVDLRQMVFALNGVDVGFFSCVMADCKGRWIRSPRPMHAATYSVPAVQQATLYKREVLLRLAWPFRFRICGDYAIAAELYKMHASSKVISIPISVFELGGLSTQRPVLLAVEACRVQREVLALSWWYRALTFVRRIATGCLLLVWYRIRER